MVDKLPQYILIAYIVSFPLIIFLGLEPIKYALLICLCITSLIIFLCNKRLYIKDKWSIIIMLTYLLIPFFIGLNNGFEKETINESVALISFMILVIVVFILNDNGYLDVLVMQKTVMIMFYLYIFLELLLMLTYFNIGIPNSIVDTMQNAYTKMRPETSATSGFGNFLPRFNLPTDIFVTTLYLLYARKKNGGSVFMWLIVLLLTMLTFSRARMAAFACISIFALGYSNFWRNITICKLCKMVLIMTSLVYLVMYIVNQLGIDYELIVYILDVRINGMDATGSDLLRESQLEYLWQTILENPFIGIGLGGYIPECLRSLNIKWLYELGYLMLIMQIGIVGMIISYLNFLSYFIRKTFMNADRKMHIPVILAYFLWFIEAGVQGSLVVGSNLGLLVICIYYFSAQNTIYSKDMTKYKN